MRRASTRRTTAATKLSWMERSTSSREPAQQAWPQLPKALNTTPSRAASKSASAKTVLGALPPSSRPTFFTVLAAWLMMWRPDLDAAGQGHHVDERRAGEVVADAAARADHDLEDALGQADLVEDAGHAERRERRDAGRLDDDHVAGRQGRGELEGGQHQREVPGTDADHDAHGLAHERGRLGDRLVGQVALGELAGVVEQVGDAQHVAAARRRMSLPISRLSQRAISSTRSRTSTAAARRTAARSAAGVRGQGLRRRRGAPPARRPRRLRRAPLATRATTSSVAGSTIVEQAAVGGVDPGAVDVHLEVAQGGRGRARSTRRPSARQLRHP